MSNISKVRDFIGKWETQDVSGIVNTFSDSPFYHNIPMDPLTSKDAIRAFIEPFMEPVTEVKWEVSFIAEDENGVVMTERVDTFIYGDKRISLPVMGTFEFEGDSLVKWRDYFDLREFENQMAALQG
ncbi:MAG: limonene-1,2-epoxide hydrolase family protein [Gammaproteobacteria bacterium]|jgi:limonene-1,2-epoxide hydrolase|tara:strand:- start:232 stop:612 length:381 start_codon:yes stop_codon:yes gene_type:complete